MQTGKATAGGEKKEKQKRVLRATRKIRLTQPLAHHVVRTPGMIKMVRIKKKKKRGKRRKERDVALDEEPSRGGGKKKKEGTQVECTSVYTTLWARVCVQTICVRPEQERGNKERGKEE